MSIGLLILRVVVGGLLFAHGAQKLFGWFSGPGLGGAEGFLEKLGFRPRRPWALVHGVAETVGGALLVLGFLTPLGASAVIGVMIVAAVVVHGDKGLWNTNGGYEFNLTLAAGAAALAFTGPGVVSVDALLGWDVAGWPWGLAAVGLGLVAAVAAIGTRRALAGTDDLARRRAA